MARSDYAKLGGGFGTALITVVEAPNTYCEMQINHFKGREHHVLRIPARNSTTTEILQAAKLTVAGKYLLLLVVS